MSATSINIGGPNSGGKGKGKCCQRKVYLSIDPNSTPPNKASFSKETKGEEDSNKGNPDEDPLGEKDEDYPIAEALLEDFKKNPDSWRKEQPDGPPEANGDAPTGRFWKRASFCGDKLDEIEGPPQYDWGSEDVG